MQCQFLTDRSFVWNKSIIYACNLLAVSITTVESKKTFPSIDRNDRNKSYLCLLNFVTSKVVEKAERRGWEPSSRYNIHVLRRSLCAPWHFLLIQRSNCHYNIFISFRYNIFI